KASLDPDVAFGELCDESATEVSGAAAKTGRVQAALSHEDAPRGDSRKQSHHNGGRVGAWRGLKSPRADADADPQDNGHAGIDGNGPGDPRERAGKADQGDESAVEHRITGARAECFPARMTDVDRGGKSRPEKRRSHAAETIDYERGARFVAIAGGFGR